MLFSLLIPTLLQLGFATIYLDDGHKISSQYVQSGTVSPYSGFVVKAGDMSDIQVSLNGNSCLIRISEIKHRFEVEVGQTRTRCNKEMKVYKDLLDESKKLNEHLKQELKQEKTFSKRLLIGSVGVSVALTATTIFFATR
jgi:hypothetical protein